MDVQDDRVPEVENVPSVQIVTPQEVQAAQTLSQLASQQETFYPTVLTCAPLLELHQE